MHMSRSLFHQFAAILVLSTLARGESGSFSPTGSMNIPRQNATAVVLRDGKVLVAGGYYKYEFLPPDRFGLRYSYLVKTDSAEIYDPVTGKFTLTTSMPDSIVSAPGWLLPDGRAVVGPYVYNPLTKEFAIFPWPTQSSLYRTATLLPDETFLMIEGNDISRSEEFPFVQPFRVAVFDPRTGSVSSVGTIVQRTEYTVTHLASGKFLIAGGFQNSGNIYHSPVGTMIAEIYDHRTRTIVPTALMNGRHGGHSAVRLADGRVLIAGGGFPRTPHAPFDQLGPPEIFDPESASFKVVNSPNTFGVSHHPAVLLPTARVIGPTGESYNLDSRRALFSPKTVTFGYTSPMTTPRGGPITVLLNSGKVLIAGGSDNRNPSIFQPSLLLSSAELFDPFWRISIDIKPGDARNAVNLRANGKLAVAILSAPASGTPSASAAAFDATTVNPASVTLAGARVASQGRGTPMSSAQDVNGDGRLDLLLHFNTGELQLTPAATASSVEAVLLGETFSGDSIRGSDKITLVP